MSGDIIERTDLAQAEFNGHVRITPEELATVGIDPNHPLVEKNGAAMDPFADEEPLACGIEDPDVCEACT